jgi:hypothetical protein
MLRNDDIAHASPSGSLPSGRYTPSNRWQVRLGDDLAADRAIMVSRHEATHSLLNCTTTYGMVILAFGSIQLSSNLRRAAQARSCLASLVDRCRTTHEIVATTWGVWATNAEPDVLLNPYPGYDDYYAQARAIAPGWRERSPAKALAVYQLARACMQSQLLEQLIRIGFDGFALEPMNEQDYPDARLKLLGEAISVAKWADLEAEASSRFVPRGLAYIFSPLDNSQRAYSHEPFFEFQEWLYLKFADMLRSQGATVLDWNVRAHQTAALTEMLEAEGERVSWRILTNENDPRAGARELIYMHMGERLMVRDEHISADVKDTPRLAPQVSAPPLADDQPPAHHVVVVRPLSRLLEQYDMSPQARECLAAKATEGLSVVLRTSRVESDGRQVMELWPISTPQDLTRIMSTFEAWYEPVSSVSLMALETRAWSERWLPVLRAAGRLTVLIDRSPASLFDEWHATGLKCAVQPVYHVDPGYPAAAALFVCVPEQPPKTQYLAVCSPHCANALQSYALSSPLSHLSERWAPGSTDHELLDITTWHLLFCEPWFDFYAGSNEELLRLEAAITEKPQQTLNRLT